MASTKSTEVTNADATPPVKTPTRFSHSRLHEKAATVEIAVADNNDHEYRMCRVHSSWRISEIKRFNDAIQSGSDFNVGLFDIAANGGAVVNENLFADAVSLTAASLTGTHDLYEAGSGVGVEEIQLPIWEQLGLSADPGKWYDLTYKGVAVGSGAGTLSILVRYAAGD